MSSPTEEALVREQAERYIALCAEYTAPYERAKIIDNWLSKEYSAKGLLVDFEKRAGPVAGKEILEIGFGNGMQSVVFAEAGAHMSGLEVNKVLHGIARENARHRQVTADLRLYDGSRFPFPDASFDYVFATSVLEHVDNPAAIVREAARVLRPGGKFYVSFPNRWAPRETHTGHWFVNYLPRRVAEVILRFLGSNAVEELNMHFLSFFSLLRLIRGTHLRVLFETGGNGHRAKFKRMLSRVGIHHSALLKTIMVVLEKNN